MPWRCIKLQVIDGLNVWKQWLSILNMKIKKSARLENKKPKLFSTNILNLTISELNYLLCKFVKEIRQPNGAEYAPDSIYHLCLCIQCYLFENGCINNIFVDNLYQPFINALDEVVRKFASIKDSSRKYWAILVKYLELLLKPWNCSIICMCLPSLIYTKYLISEHSLTGVVEEELLWECEQLGGHSPHVLLATLLFFNTKFFKLSVSFFAVMMNFLWRIGTIVCTSNLVQVFGKIWEPIKESRIDCRKKFCL